MGEHFDVLIVGAGISGIGAAYHLSHQCPGKSFLVLETLEAFGGTWRIHTYPGVRSDSDLFTFGYRFKPWNGPPIASRDEILTYLNEVIAENNLGQRIRYGHKIVSADWSSAKQHWTVCAERVGTCEIVTVTAGFLWTCPGYYRQARGYTPDWAGLADFRGRVVHPQTWPNDIDLSGKKVIVIGSGATAATLVPAISEKCEHVTLLQRSPTYFFADANRNELADTLRTLDVDPTWIHEIVRRKLLHEHRILIQLAVEQPEIVKTELLKGVRAYLGPEFDIEKHFTPKYRPWQQRIAFLPDGDLFKAIASGKASIVTDHIERFMQDGILLKSGERLAADVIITATGFNLSVVGDIPFTVDDERVDFSGTVTWRGLMVTQVPNMVWVMGYLRASWTLRVDLISDFVCRLLKFMDAKRARSVRAVLRGDETAMRLEQWADPEEFNSGYLMRSAHLLPKRSDMPQWRATQDYWLEREELPAIDLDASPLVYGR